MPAKKQVAPKKYALAARKKYRDRALRAWETRRRNAKRNGKKRAA